jgi:DNA replication protein DnaC
MNKSRNWVEEIYQYSKDIKLPVVRQCFQELIKEVNQKDASYEEFLALLLQKEWDARQEAAQYNRIRRAEFPYKKYLEDLSVYELPEDAQKKFKHLKTLEFIKEGRNLILAGSPGTGKTHMAIGLGMKACMEGYKVWFTTVPLLINQLKECRSEKTLRAFQNRFEKYDLVIADEMGYISFDKEGAELLFTHLSLRGWAKINDYHDEFVVREMGRNLSRPSYDGSNDRPADSPDISCQYEWELLSNEADKRMARAAEISVILTAEN